MHIHVPTWLLRTFVPNKSPYKMDAKAAVVDMFGESCNTYIYSDNCIDYDDTFFTTVSPICMI